MNDESEIFVAIRDALARAKHAGHEQAYREFIADHAQTERWYFVNSRGQTTRCSDEADAQESAQHADQKRPECAPHIAFRIATREPCSSVTTYRNDTERLDWLADALGYITATGIGGEVAIPVVYAHETSTMLDDWRNAIDHALQQAAP